MNPLQNAAINGRLLTASAFAGRLGLSVKTVRRMVARRDLTVVRIGTPPNDGEPDRRPVRLTEGELARLCEIVPRVPDAVGVRP